MSYRAPSTPPGGHMIYQHSISTRLFCFHKWWKEARPFSWWRVSPSPPKKHSIDPPNLHVVNKAKMVACCHDNGGWLCSSCKSREQAADGPAARVASLLTVRQQGNLCKSFNWQQRSHRNMIIAVNRARCVCKVGVAWRMASVVWPDDCYLIWLLCLWSAATRFKKFVYLFQNLVFPSGNYVAFSSYANDT